MAANPDFIYRPPMTPYLDIVYQDDDIVVLNKGSGLLTVPGRLPEHQDCLQNRVARVLPTATIVHRLDMATSGLLLMALNKDAHVDISRQFEKRQTQKSYRARVYGKLEYLQGEINLPLICDWPNRPKQKVDHEHGKSSKTLYKLLQQDDDSALVELIPITGRSHQLRVHMLALGHPILGDRLYAHEKALTQSERLQLHALSLTISHPRTKQSISFKAPCPFT
ncbi:pseudouridine synthase [Thalassotalea atypica]|uniref:pseudouridine synthase n=1 Tax=Thalassotalea atypica TaxID=2054316 RepID=UPI002572B2D6|nr:pseudouridine synthase [Thalassotalea atypica]